MQVSSCRQLRVKLRKSVASFPEHHFEPRARRCSRSRLPSRRRRVRCVEAEGLARQVIVATALCELAGVARRGLGEDLARQFRLYHRLVLPVAEQQEKQQDDFLHVASSAPRLRSCRRSSRFRACPRKRRSTPHCLQQMAWRSKRCPHAPTYRRLEPLYRWHARLSQRPIR